MAKHKLLFVDDDISFSMSCIARLDKNKYSFDSAESPKQCREKMDDCAFDIAVIDIHFENSTESGLDLLKWIKSNYPDTAILMMSSSDNIEIVHEILKLGANDFVSKNKNEVDEIIMRIDGLLARKIATQSDADAIEMTLFGLGIKIYSEKMRKLYQEAFRYRSSRDIHVLIQGETGSGKEMLAAFIGRRDDATRPYIAFNCASLAPDLIEAELFGHEKGSFSGANATRIGLLESANGGTIFLDEVACLSAKAQTNLLRFLDKREVRSIGSNKTKIVNVRVVSATNENLHKMVEEGKFREDLLARLSAKRLVIPSLRERKEEILPLARFFLNKFGKPESMLSKDVESILESLSWPTNVRQLQNTIKSMVASCGSDVFALSDIPLDLFRPLSSTANSNTDSDDVVSLKLSTGISFEEAQRRLFLAMIELSKRSLGKNPSQFEIAKFLNMSRAQYQRKLYQSQAN